MADRGRRIDEETRSRIERLARQQVPIKQIARVAEVSKNTVKKYGRGEKAG